MKRKCTAVIESNRPLTADVYEMWLKTDLAQEAQAGQFVALYTGDAAMLLPRPISICEVDREGGRLRLVFRIAGKGTAWFAKCPEQSELQILGVLGNGYPLAEADGKKALLLGGGIGIPPLLELAHALQGSAAEITIGLGYRDHQLFLKEDFAPLGQLLLATEDGSAYTKGNVLDAVREAEENSKLKPDVIFACGPMPMLRAIKRYAAQRQIPAWLSMEERMACGVGACLGCVCRTTKKDAHSQVYNARICTEGPVFPAEDVAILPEDTEGGNAH